MKRLTIQKELFMPSEKTRLSKRKKKKLLMKRLSIGKLKLLAMSKKKTSFKIKLWMQKDKINY